MAYQFFFPYPAKNLGLFKQRYQLIKDYEKRYKSGEQFTFQEQPPNINDIHRYFQLIKKNRFSKEYLGDLLTDSDKWKSTASLADLDNFYKGLSKSLEKGFQRAFFMTNSGGHHADNTHYELFCPLNQLFFIVEFLNYQDNFPQIAWVDLDAHFGNGDKKIFDTYQAKMKSEVNNLKGICFHNDSGDIDEKNYKGVSYDPQISEKDFLDLVKNNLIWIDKAEYLVLFWGTDIFTDDYGNNTNISLQVIPQIIKFFEKIANNLGAYLIIIQTGGQEKKNIEKLIALLIESSGA